MQEETCILTERGRKTGAHGGSIQRSHVAPVFVAKQVIAKSKNFYTRCAEC